MAVIENQFNLEDHRLENGLMDEIEDLIAPPIIETNCGEPKKKKSKQEYRKPRLDEYCNFCDDGGELVCCDLCPASFHMKCHNPPVEEHQVALGARWLCNRCRKCPTVVEPEAKAVPNGIKPPRNGEIATKVITFSPHQISAAKEALAKQADERKLSEQQRNEIAAQRVVQNESKLQSNPLLILSKAADAMNATEFNLPRQLFVYEEMPNGEIPQEKLQLTNLPHQFDADGLVPLPAKTCYVCCKSCRQAPLIQCDFCPLLFHGDCVDPPLASMPRDRWMCPVHVEHFLDAHFLSSPGLTERLKLWNEHARQPVSDLRIKLEFLRKAGRRHPPFRWRRWQPPKRDRFKVPVAIKDSYRHPTPLSGSPNLNANPDQPCCSHVAGIERRCPSDSERHLVEGLVRMKDTRPALAVLRPYDSSQGPELALHKSGATVGLKADAELPLKCAHVAEHHATIFYDKLSTRFELLNYSLYGTTVDGVLYRSNLNSKVNSVDDRTCDGQIRKLLFKRVNCQSESHVMPVNNNLECNCTHGCSMHTDSRRKGGWEGPARLHQGSVIEFGCLKYVFCMNADIVRLVKQQASI